MTRPTELHGGWSARLPLYLVLGGLITVDSDVGKGSTFALWLPAVHAGTVETQEAVGTAG